MIVADVNTVLSSGLHASRALYTRIPSAARGGFGAAIEAAQAARAPEAGGGPYTVKKGDTLSGIVREHLRSQGAPATERAIHEGVQAAARANGMKNPNLIHPGQKLDLTALGGREAMPAQVPAPAAPAAKATPAPPVEVKELAAPAPPAAGAAPTAQGGPAHPLHRRDVPAQVVKRLPPKAPAARPKAAQEDGHAHGVAAQSPWMRTVDGAARLTAGYGARKDPFTVKPEFHEGIDLAAKSGTNIRPISAGVVTFSGWKPGYGRMVVVNHGGGMESVYAHNSKNLVKAGQRVSADTVLGQVGATGRSTGPHLHLEVRKNGKAINPVPYLAGEPQRLAKAE